MRTLCLLLCLLHGSLSAARAQAQSVTNLANGVSARVNDAVITYQQVRDYMREFEAPIFRQYQDQPEERIRKLIQLQAEGLEQLIERRLVIDEFKTSGGLIPERYIEDEIRNRIRDRFGDRVSLTRELQAKGLTSEDYRERVKDEIVVDFMRRRNLSNEKILISPKRIETYFQTNQASFSLGEAVRLRIISLNKIAGEDNSPKQKIADEIVEKVKGGASFADMAKAQSEDSFAKDGGDRKEMLETSALREEFRGPASKLPLRTVSPVIETPEGFFILFVEERTAAHTRPLAEVRDEIEKILILQERNRLQKKWIDRLRKKAFVVYF